DRTKRFDSITVSFNEFRTVCELPEQLPHKSDVGRPFWEDFTSREVGSYRRTRTYEKERTDCLKPSAMNELLSSPGCRATAVASSLIADRSAFREELAEGRRGESIEDGNNDVTARDLPIPAFTW
ncbi:hypothetical protein FOZ63_030730, partial [Perkinsus olseni]